MGEMERAGAAVGQGLGGGTDYNRLRRHSTLGYLSPEKFELKNVA